MGLDLAIQNFIESFRTPFLTKFFETITLFGSAPIIIAISTFVFAILLLKNKKHTAILFAYLTIVDALITFIIKNVVHRSRPDILERLITQDGYSLPSGHSSSSILLYGAIVVLMLSTAKQPPAPSHSFIRPLTITLTILWILFIGISRIYLGVHYPTDVVIGYAIGGMLLTIFIKRREK